MKIVLLQPPSVNGNRYVRDVYCAGLAKGLYSWPPLDLMMISGTLARRHELIVIDAQAERISTARTEERLASIGPDAIIFITSSASKIPDLSFMQRVKRFLPAAHLIMMGDLALTRPGAIMDEHPLIDAAILNYFDPGVAVAFRDDGLHPTANVVVRGKTKTSTLTPTVVHSPPIPTPRHDLFPLHCYSAPWARRRKLTTTSTSYGCPFGCTFCTVSLIDYVTRPVDDVLEELRLVLGIGCKEIYFQDFLFTARRNRTLGLCNAIVEEGLNISWCCLSKVGTFDQEVLEGMKKAGCHTIELGLESGSDRLLGEMGKGFTVAEAVEAVDFCVNAGIRVNAIFMLGYPGETLEDIESSVDLALKLPLHLVTFVIVTPCYGTKLAESVEADKGEINWDQPYDDSCNILPLSDLDAGNLKRLRNRAERRFYLRPAQVLRLALSTGSITELRWKVMETIWFLWRVLLSVLPNRDTASGRS